jgi:hypothetical protein
LKKKELVKKELVKKKESAKKNKLEGIFYDSELAQQSNKEFIPTAAPQLYAETMDDQRNDRQFHSAYSACCCL